MSSAADLTARARIRNAALERFGLDGVAKTSIRAIAEDAGVSPALVLHHFGSKEGLRQACDEYVVHAMRGPKMRAMTGVGSPAEALGALEEGRPVIRYLARALVDGSPAASALFREVVEETEGFLDVGVRAGTVQPTDRPRDRAAVLVALLLGGLVLHRQLSEALGVDTLTLEGLARMQRASLELLATPTFLDDAFVKGYTDLLDEELRKGQGS